MKVTRPLRTAARAGGGLFDRILCVAGAVAFSQMPEFMQQYLQRLGGHLAEARRHLLEFDNVAAQSGVSLDQLIAQTKAGNDAVTARLGDVMAATGARVHELAAAESALRDAAPWERPFVFLRQVDGEIAQATWAVFKPAVPTTFEGLLYAAAGMLVFLVIYHGALRYPIERAWARRQARRGVVVGGAG